MNLKIDRIPESLAAAELSDTLSRWYAAHAAIRHLWALDGPDQLTVLVTLQPTADGDDTLPLWLAKSDEWTHDLRTRTRRAVQLRLLIADVLDDSIVELNSAVIAELSWRDCWESP